MKLIKKVDGEIFNVPVGNIKYIGSIVGVIQQSDYININGFMAYLQNLSRAEDTYALTIPTIFGLKNENNLTMVTLEIDY